MKYFVIALLFICPPAQAQVSCNQNGTQTRCSDGSSYTTHGERMRGSDGTTYTRSGDKITTSRGETYYQRDENTVIGPNGDMYDKRGDTVHGPRGTTIRGVEDDNIFYRKDAEKPQDTRFEDYRRAQNERDARAAEERDAQQRAVRAEEQRIEDEQARIEHEKRMAEMLGKNNPVSVDADGFYE